MPNDIAQIIHNLRDCMLSENATPMDMAREFLRLPQFRGGAIRNGYFVTRDGEIVHDHWWIEMPDASIFDPNQDKFGQSGFDGVVWLNQDDLRARHYFPKETDYETVVDFANQIEAELKQRRQAATFSQIADAYGSRPVGDPNKQSRDDMPDTINPSGQAKEPNRPVEKEFKPEEFEDEIRKHLGEAAVDWNVLEDERAFIELEVEDVLYNLSFDLSTYEDDETPVWRAYFTRVDPFADVSALGTKHVVKLAMAVTEAIVDFIDIQKESIKLHLNLPTSSGRRLSFFASTLSKHLKDHKVEMQKPRTLILAPNLKEVDHPEFMPDGESEWAPRHDPNLELGHPQERQPRYNRGHPKP